LGLFPTKSPEKPTESDNKEEQGIGNTFVCFGCMLWWLFVVASLNVGIASVDLP
jgi:hypothetical protein